MSWLKGKKTYLVSGLMVLVSIIDLITGEISLAGFFTSPNLNTLLSGVGLGTLRSGVAANQSPSISAPPLF